MLILSGHVDRWMGNENQSLNIGLLTTIFFSLNVLAATQDIVVDGWALTMLKRFIFLKFFKRNYEINLTIIFII